eukprot:4671954-Amphidinium_carterae.1
MCPAPKLQNHTIGNEIESSNNAYCLLLVFMVMFVFFSLFVLRSIWGGGGPSCGSPKFYAVLKRGHSPRRLLCFDPPTLLQGNFEVFSIFGAP